MNPDMNRNGFTAEHHAMLFAWLAKEVTGLSGEEKAGPVIREAVRRYGEQRGHRMALRCLRDGRGLSMLNYLSYGEWKAAKGELKMQIVEKRPDLRVTIPRCAWFTAWTESGLAQYGRYYCDEIDSALVRGFSPELRIDVRETKPGGADRCEMVFRDADLGFSNMVTYLCRKLFRPGGRALMPWDYHAGHLYRTFRDTAVARLGEQGDRGCEAALDEFSDRYGEKASQTVKGYLGTDFEVIP